MKLFERIIYALYRKRKLLMVILAVIVVLYPVIANAQDQTSQPQPETEEQITQKMQSYMLIILRAMSAIFWPILMLIGGLLDNSLIFDGKMGETLLEIWVQVRNIVNIIFVVILVLIALYNVLGLGENGPEQLKPLELKQALPKFIIALIVVNFSYIGMKVALDFTNVMTTAVFALPSQVVASSQNFQKFTAENEKIICEPDSPFYGLFCTQKQFNERGKAWFAQLDRSNLAVTMAMQFGQLPYANRIQDSVEGIFQLTFNIIFNLVLFIVYALSFIALFVVLVVRLPVLWLGIALSPIAALTMAFPPITKLMGGGEGGNFMDKFVKHAVAPLVIGVWLALGYIMISAMKSDPGVHNGDFAVSLLDIDPNALITRIDDLQEVLMAAATVAVVWMGVFGAAKGTFAEKVTETIRGGAEKVGGFVAKLPMFMQVIPYKPGQGIGLGNIWGSITRKMEEVERDRKLPIGELQSKDAKHVLKASSPQNFMERLNDNHLGTLGELSVFEHMRSTLNGLKDGFDQDRQSNKDLLAQFQRAGNTEGRLRALYRLAKENPQNRELQTLVQNHDTEDHFIQAGLENERAVKRSSEGGGGESPDTITDKTVLYRNLPDISALPSAYIGQAIFRNLSMTESQIKEFADEIGRLTPQQQERLNPFDGNNLRFKLPNGQYDRDAFMRAVADARPSGPTQSPAPSGGQPTGTPPGTPPTP